VSALFQVKRKKLFFSIIAVLVCAVLVGSTMAALNFMSTANASSSPKTTIELQTPLPKDCISAQQAIQTAKNYTNQYAKENNRTITEIKAVFGYSSTYYFDNNPSESDIQMENRTYYVWNVTATFQEIAPENFLTDGQSALVCSVPRYLVSIWGYSGQIKSQGPIIIVNQQNLYNNLQVTVHIGLDSVPEGCISAEQAIHLATSYINQYVTGHNRTVIDIKAGLGMAQENRGSAGNGHYPIWSVEARFAGSELTNPYDYWLPPEQYHIYGYYVGIWADNTQIRNLQEQGVF
jgi:hypothetical protein